MDNDTVYVAKAFFLGKVNLGLTRSKTHKIYIVRCGWQIEASLQNDKAMASVVGSSPSPLIQVMLT